MIQSRKPLPNTTPHLTRPQYWYILLFTFFLTDYHLHFLNLPISFANFACGGLGGISASCPGSGPGCTPGPPTTVVCWPMGGGGGYIPISTPPLPWFGFIFVAPGGGIYPGGASLLYSGGGSGHVPSGLGPYAGCCWPYGCCW